MIDWYDWAGGREAMLRFGPADGPVVVAAMPLLEEWNRTRAFVVTLLRALAERGIASVLPDLPGHGESLARIPDLPTLRQAMSAAASSAGGPTLALGMRSGALLDADAPHRGRWYLSPQTGAELRRNLERVRLAAGGRSDDGPVDVAGTRLSTAFLASLDDAQPASCARIVRLESDPRPADRKLDGAPLWRRAEPGNDPALAILLADDIAGWAVTCDG